MLSKIINDSIKEELKTYSVSNDVEIYTRTLYKEDSTGKTAIFIHGGGSGGNHTMIVRPSKWMMEKDLFSKVILPDRRGEGLSSPLTKKISIKEHAFDMKNLLDVLGIDEKITAIGISYGGPIALTLADIDNRIDEVILIASSPSLKDVKGFRGFLYKHNILEPIGRFFYKLYLGKDEPQYPNFENVYDLKSEKEIMKLFTNAIKHTDKKMYESLMLQNASTIDKENSSIDKDIKINTPIYQVIGEKDEIWETDLSEYKERFTDIKSSVILGANHKACLLRAEEFYNELFRIYEKKNNND